jgi:peroxiredoxin
MMRTKLIKIVSGLMSILLIGLIIIACSSAAADKGPEVGKLAPDFHLSTLDGRTVSLSDYRGQPVLLNFWQRRCPPCRFEMPFLQEVYEQRADEGLVVLGVNLLEERQTVEEFVQELGLTFPILLTTTTEVPLDYNIRPIPVTFLIDKDGIIRDIKIGAFASIDEIHMELSSIMP